MKKIILASQSPRRRELLTELGLNFEAVSSPFQELTKTEQQTWDPKLIPAHNATGKARAVAKSQPNALVIGCDTVGLINNQILEKPTDRQNAFDLIQLISGTTHQVLSSICVVDSQTQQEVTKTVTTQITMKELSTSQINAYLDRAQWQDKAAAYAIQGRGALFVENINGDYFNVVGLPIFTLNQMLNQFGFDLLTSQFIN